MDEGTTIVPNKAHWMFNILSYHPDILNIWSLITVKEYHHTIVLH